MLASLPLAPLGIEFLEAWIPVQFKSWQRAQHAIEREHSDRDAAFESLPDSVKLLIFEFVPLQIALLVEAGRANLIRMREAGRERERESVAELLEELAKAYHNSWHVVREMLIRHLSQPPKRRPDDKPWDKITAGEQAVVREIIWQWCIAFADDLGDEHFRALWEAAAH